jgi:hypothetical protein
MKWVPTERARLLLAIRQLAAEVTLQQQSQSPSSEVRKNRVSGALQIQLESLILAQNER